MDSDLNHSEPSSIPTMDFDLDHSEPFSTPTLDSDLDHNADPSVFPFDRLPIDIQSRILGLLPITTLVVCKAVSRSWRSLISSAAFTDSYPRNLSRRRHDLIFLIWCGLYDPGSVYAYLPAEDRWIHFRLRASSNNVPAAGSSLILFEWSQAHFFIIHPFSRQTPPQLLPPVLHPDRWRKAIALFQDGPSDYRILVVGPADGLHPQIYDSRSSQWEPCPELPRHFSSLETAVYLDGMLFCLSWSPNRILTLDPVAGQWTILDLAMPAPSLYCSRILVFGGELYLTGGIRENSRVTRIGIWELDRLAMVWTEFGFMPDEYLADFTMNGFQGLSMVHCMGVICLTIGYPAKILMCDMVARRWWWPCPCGVPENERMRFGHAIEPYIDLLK